MVKAQDKNGKDITPHLQKRFHNFLSSLSDVLVDITALEVNTMVVEEISVNKFIPWEAYRDVYLISEQNLEKQQIHLSLRPHYLNLRKKLETEYCAYLLEDKTLQKETSELRRYYESLGDPLLELNTQTIKLPNPLNPDANLTAEIEKIQTFLENGRSLRCLRKLIELKVALDNRSMALKKIKVTEPETAENAVTTDIVYAQTIIQMDGDIINRYNQNLFEHKHKDIMLEIHKQGVSAGGKQWHGLLEFMVNLVELLTIQHSSRKELLNRN